MLPTSRVAVAALHHGFPSALVETHTPTTAWAMVVRYQGYVKMVSPAYQGHSAVALAKYQVCGSSRVCTVAATRPDGVIMSHTHYRCHVSGVYARKAIAEAVRGS